MPTGVPAESCQVHDLSGDREALRHIGQDGGETYQSCTTNLRMQGRGASTRIVIGRMDTIDDEQRLEEAAQWSARLTAHDCTEFERQRFERWLAESEKHRLAYQEIM